ncbi:YkgJ family cysteine cluster protein, partial [Bacteroidota bacterium]
ICDIFKIKPSVFFSKYFKKDEEYDYVFNQTPCPFLTTGNICSIYDIRPKTCREYPHTDRKNIHQILDLTYQNTFICPVFLQLLKN